MQKNTIIVTKNNVTPIQQICVCDLKTDVEPPSNSFLEVDYNTLSAAEKVQFDDCVTMILSKLT